MHYDLEIFQLSKVFKLMPSFQTDGNDIVTGHKLPVINHWISTDVGIKHIASLRGHMEIISYTAISNNCKLIISGHIDGKLSVFTTNPHKFLRIISTDTNVPIEFIYVFQPTSAIIVFQRENESSTKLTLFSCNGKLLATNTLRCSVLNCTSTTFAEGTQKNYFFVLSDEKVFVLSSTSLKVKEEYNLTGPKPISITIWNKYNIFIARSDRTLVRWMLEYE